MYQCCSAKITRYNHKGQENIWMGILYEHPNDLLFIYFYTGKTKVPQDTVSSVKQNNTVFWNLASVKLLGLIFINVSLFVEL